MIERLATGVQAGFDGAAYNAVILLGADPARLRAGRDRHAYCMLQRAVAARLRALALQLDQHANRVELDMDEF